MEAGNYSLKWLGHWLFTTGVMLFVAGAAVANPAQGPVEVLQSMTDTLVEIAEQDPDVVNDIPRLRQAGFRQNVQKRFEPGIDRKGDR